MVQQEDNVAIGIDLGTTSCCVAIFRHGQIDIIENTFGLPVTPSYVTLDVDAEHNCIVGDVSKNLAHENPHNTIFDVKRLIGRKFLDRRVQNNMRLWPFEIVPFGVWPKIKVNNSTFFPEEITAHLLRCLKETAQTFLGHPVTNAVITVPAYFRIGQRQATKDAGNLAGLNVLQIINEPTAAAIAYNLDQNSDRLKTCVIFDFGGGTLDVSVIKMDRDKIDIISVDGHTHLGGEDIDKSMVKFCVLEFHKKTGIDLTTERTSLDKVKREKATSALRRLKSICEREKKFLSRASRVFIATEALYEGHDIHVEFTQEIFNQLNMKKFHRCIEITERCVRNAKLLLTDIDEVVLVGGSSKIPKLQQMLRNLFSGKQLTRRIDQETAVASGAAIYASSHNSTAVKLNISDVVPLPIGIQVDESFEEEDQRQKTDFLVVIPANSKIPCSVTRRFATIVDNQDVYQLLVFEGHELMTEKNYFLANFIISHLPKCPEGEFVDITMDVDAEGLLHVSAYLPGYPKFDPRMTLEYSQTPGVQEVKERKEPEKLFEPDRESVEKIVNKMESIIAQSSKEVEIYVALYDYKSRTKEDLNLKKGQLLEILDTKLDDWWIGKLKDSEEKGFIPSSYVCKLSLVEAEPWFFGNTSRIEAGKKLLRDGIENGSFLIRTSEKGFALSIRVQDSVKHYKIFRNNEGHFYINVSSIFRSLQELVVHYSLMKTTELGNVPLGQPCIRQEEEKEILTSLSYHTVNQSQIDSTPLQLSSKLTNGRFGEIWNGKYNFSVDLNILKINKVTPTFDKTNFLEKSEKIRKMSHRNLIQFYGVSLSKNSIWLVMDSVKNKSLLEYLKNRSESLELTEVLEMSIEIALGMEYLESQKFFHGDLSPQNIFVSPQYQLKISNFGLIHLLDGVLVESRSLFSMRRTAPEVLRDQSKFSIKSDVWSFGILLTELVTKGERPYGDMSDEEIRDKVCRKGYRIMKPKDCSENLYKIMTDTWHPYGPKRPSFQQLRDQLEYIKYRGKSRVYVE